MHSCVSILSLVEKELGCFEFLGFKNKADMNMVEDMTLECGGASLCICPGVV